MQAWAIKAGAAVLLVALLVAGYSFWANHQQGIGEARATAAYNKAIDDQKLTAAATLALETAKTVAIEKRLQDLKNRQEVKDANNKKITAALTARLHDLTDPHGRLRDPHADAECGSRSGGTNDSNAAGPGNSPDHGTEATGILSAELSGLLQRLTIEADEINNAYISCRADAEAVRTQ
ncbi:MAG: hypothetical protein KKH22_12035 [Proteobacteria bacterium]|nr:hypothetical protein [Pseudomonadota bacterium]